MKTRGGYIQGYNVQAAADTDHRVIVAQGLTAEGSDQRQLEHMIKAIKTSEKRLPKELSADSGYCSERNLEILEGQRHPRLCRHRTPSARKGRGDRSQGAPRGNVPGEDGPASENGRDGQYRRRKFTIEPVFGQIMQARRFRQFLLRGLRKVRLEWALVCPAHNVVKLFVALAKPQDQRDAGKRSWRKTFIQDQTSTLLPLLE